MRNDTRETFVDLAARLKAARIAQKKTMRAVAKDVEVNASTVRTWELGMNIPNGAHFIAWVQALGFYLDITDAEEEGQ